MSSQKNLLYTWFFSHLQFILCDMVHIISIDQFIEMLPFYFGRLNLLGAFIYSHSSLPYPDYDTSSNDTIIMYTLKRARRMQTPFFGVHLYGPLGFTLSSYNELELVIPTL